MDQPVPGLTVRHACNHDIPVLAALFERSVRGTCGAEYSPAQIDLWARQGTPERFWELFRSGLTFFLAEGGNRAAGFASVSGQGWLHSLFVDPAFQRAGVGSRLLAEAMDYARTQGARTVKADVSLTAEPFFRRHGFTLVREQQVTLRSTVFRNARYSRAIES